MAAAAKFCRSIYTQKNSHRPAKSNDDPAAVLAFCFIKYNIGHYTITHDDE